MIRLWASIAIKLGITQEEALLLHALLRGWLNPLARRKAVIVVGTIVEKFDLDETSFETSYARQLLVKGVITPTEMEVFMGSYHEDSEAQSTGKGGVQPAEAEKPASGGNLVRLGRIGKPSRGPSSGPGSGSAA